MNKVKVTSSNITKKINHLSTMANFLNLYSVIRMAVITFVLLSIDYLIKRRFRYFSKCLPIEICGLSTFIFAAGCLRVCSFPPGPAQHANRDLVAVIGCFRLNFLELIPVVVGERTVCEFNLRIGQVIVDATRLAIR